MVTLCTVLVFACLTVSPHGCSVAVGAGVDWSRSGAVLGAGAGPVGGGRLPSGDSAGAARLGVLALADRWQAGLPAAALSSPRANSAPVRSARI